MLLCAQVGIHLAKLINNLKLIWNEILNKESVSHVQLAGRAMTELGPEEKGSSPIDELIELTAQSLSRLEIKEHFNIIKEIGRGKYGRVLLVTHRCRGMYTKEQRYM